MKVIDAQALLNATVGSPVLLVFFGGLALLTGLLSARLATRRVADGGPDPRRAAALTAWRGALYVPTGVGWLIAVVVIVNLVERKPVTAGVWPLLADAVVLGFSSVLAITQLSKRIRELQRHTPDGIPEQRWPQRTRILVNTLGWLALAAIVSTGFVPTPSHHRPPTFGPPSGLTTAVALIVPLLIVAVLFALILRRRRGRPPYKSRRPRW